MPQDALQPQNPRRALDGEVLENPSNLSDLKERLKPQNLPKTPEKPKNMDLLSFEDESNTHPHKKEKRDKMKLQRPPPLRRIKRLATEISWVVACDQPHIPKKKRQDRQSHETTTQLDENRTPRSSKSFEFEKEDVPLETRQGEIREQFPNYILVKDEPIKPTSPLQ